MLGHLVSWGQLAQPLGILPKVKKHEDTGQFGALKSLRRPLIAPPEPFLYRRTLSEVLKPKLLNQWSVGIGLSWVQLERVNHKPFSTHSTRESEWTTGKAVLHCCLLVFERNQFDSG
ncbi:hypothetical protein H5410_003168 [Solanum commersonii]|uniref:Uncharacterized protein n=1 Tax=Solanum commersonii TaxID=4109 RepID=A0A9J6B4A3_SOLCO|nr:hypothetical protein H5410_003168 [Solanum commersonii]